MRRVAAPEIDIRPSLRGDAPAGNCQHLCRRIHAYQFPALADRPAQRRKAQSRPRTHIQDTIAMTQAQQVDSARPAHPIDRSFQRQHVVQAGAGSIPVQREPSHPFSMPGRGPAGVGERFQPGPGRHCP